MRTNNNIKKFVLLALGISIKIKIIRPCVIQQASHDTVLQILKSFKTKKLLISSLLYYFPTTKFQPCSSAERPYLNSFNVSRMRLENTRLAGSGRV